MNRKLFLTMLSCLLLIHGLLGMGCQTKNFHSCLKNKHTGNFPNFNYIDYLNFESKRSPLLNLFIPPLICNETQRRLADKEEIEQIYLEATGKSIDKPCGRLEYLVVEPKNFLAGEKGKITGKYSVMGPKPAEPAKGWVRLLSEDDVRLLSVPMQDVEEGSMEIERSLFIPVELIAGDYQIEMEIQNGDSIAKRKAPFTVIKPNMEE